MSADRYALAADGARLRYRVEGREDGLTVMFSHSLGVDSDTWDPQVAALAGRFRIVRYDARGHGRSEATEGEYTIEQAAHDALSVMDAARVRDVQFVGLSMGGMVGMWLAVHAPGRLRRLVLANTTAHIPLRAMWNERIAEARSSGLDAIAGATLQRWVGAAYRQANPAGFEAMVETMRTMSPVGYAGTAAMLRDTDLRPVLGRIGIPVLVITGEQDVATPPAAAQALAGDIPQATVGIVAGAGHLSNVEAPESFNGLLAGFLDAP